jgi:hypothetical protein
MGQLLSALPIRPSAHCLEARRATRKASPKQVPACQHKLFRGKTEKPIAFYLNICQGDSGELWRTAGWEASAVVMLCYDSNIKPCSLPDGLPASSLLVRVRQAAAPLAM